MEIVDWPSGASGDSRRYDSHDVKVSMKKERNDYCAPFFRNDSDLCFEFDLHAFDADPAQQVESLFGAVIVAVNHPSDTGLNNQF